MQIQSMDGLVLFDAFYSGGKEVIRQQESLNRINVFPVPDGDTGSNLTLTMSSIMENSWVSSSAGETIRSMAEAALFGARGNSGIIFAQFLYGLSDSIGEAGTLTIEMFGKATREAAAKAYSAIHKPVEGTMLTVIKDWSEAVVGLLPRVTHFLELFSRSLGRARSSLRETQQKLAVLRENGVVDAGAKGFVHFLHGISEFLRRGAVDKDEGYSVPEIEDIPHVFDTHEQLAHRYCTEALIREPGIGDEQLKTEISSFGDSLIVAGTRGMVRVHLHTNNPADLFLTLHRIGSVIQQKAEDMVRQFDAIHRRKCPIALVTDSTCDLPGELLDRYQIHVVPLNLIVGESQFLDRLTIDPEHFYHLMDHSPNYPKTSQPSAAVFRNLYSFLCRHYESVIAIHLSSRLSGTWNASKLAAEETANSKKITVIDSKGLSGSLGLIVLRAAEEISSGKSHEEVVEAVRQTLPKANILVSVSSLKYMVRGGRVSPLKGFLAGVLNLKPIVSVDGQGHSVLHGKAFSRRANMNRIIQMVLRLNAESPLRYYAIGHAHAPELAAEYSDALSLRLGRTPLYTIDISPIVGLNAGIGAVSVVTLKS
ncbi:MAG TPA: DegV family protein [Spirochaetia bacterium]|nr:DegV family protein [Spirochaetia bacterium]